MSNTVYPAFVSSVIDGSAGDLSSVTWKVHLFDTATYAATDTVLSDLPTPLGSATLSVSVSAGEIQAAQVSIAGVASLKTITSMVVTAGASDSLVRWIDTNASSVPLSILTSGQPVFVSWPNGVMLQIGPSE